MTRGELATLRRSVRKQTNAVRKQVIVEHQQLEKAIARVRFWCEELRTFRTVIRKIEPWCGYLSDGRYVRRVTLEFFDSQQYSWSFEVELDARRVVVYRWLVRSIELQKQADTLEEIQDLVLIRLAQAEFTEAEKITKTLRGGG